MYLNDTLNAIGFVCDTSLKDTDTAKRIYALIGDDVHNDDMYLKYDRDGLSFSCEGKTLMGDLTKMKDRIKMPALNSELLVKAARIKEEGQLYAIDATAGLGEDSLLLAAAGFHVTMYEKNPIIYELLSDSLIRASKHPALVNAISRMHIVMADSTVVMAEPNIKADVILLDPMFPERQKSALVKNKLQVIQKLEEPCRDELKMLYTAVSAKPKRLIIKRPPKGAFLAGIKPDYSITGKAVRFDCIQDPYSKKHILFK